LSGAAVIIVNSHFNGVGSDIHYGGTNQLLRHTISPFFAKLGKPEGFLAYTAYIILEKSRNVNSGEKDSEKINVYFVIGASGFNDQLTPTGKQIINNLFMASSSFTKSYFILIDSYSDYKKLQLESWYQSQVDPSNGIWLGPDVGSQMAIGINNLSLEDKKADYDFVGVSVVSGEHKMIKYVVDTGEE
jgi:hypothetical protein